MKADAILGTRPVNNTSHEHKTSDPRSMHATQRIRSRQGSTHAESCDVKSRDEQRAATPHLFGAQSR